MSSLKAKLGILAVGLMLSGCMQATTYQSAPEATLKPADKAQLAKAKYAKVVNEPFRRAIVDYHRREMPGSIVVDSDNIHKRIEGLPASLPGGVDNPLVARALYLYQGNRDTLFRIHGTNQPEYIGASISSGCIRMTNEDVIDLYSRVNLGTRVVVLPQTGRHAAVR